MRIIVNSDDLGMSRTVNEATFGLMAEGLVTSSTILAGADAVGELPARLAGFPRASFGVHLCLTQFRPLTGPAGLEPLLGPDGAFANVVRGARLDRPLLRAIRRELLAQVEVVRGLGVRISHLDSHHHVHTIPALFPVLREVLRASGAPAVRLSKNLYSRQERPGPLLLARKALFNFALTHFPARAHTDCFTNLPGLLEALPHLTDLEKRTGRNLSVEVMIHAGVDTQQGREETALLRTLPGRAPGLQLIGYHEL